MVLSVNAVFGGDRAKMQRFYDICRPALATHWNVSGSVFDKFSKVVDGLEYMALRLFEETKSGDDLRLFFSWYANRILGVPLPRPMTAIESLCQFGIPPKAGLIETELVHKTFMDVLVTLGGFLKENVACL